MDDLEKLIRRIIVGSAIVSGSLIAAKSASWLVGLASKITVEGVTIVTAGVLLGYVANGIGEIIATPIAPTATPSPAPAGSATLSLAAPASLVAATFTIGTPGPLVVTAEYASLTQANLSHPAAAGVAKAMATLQEIWATLASTIPFLEIPAPAFPSTPKRTVIAAIPPAQLSIDHLSPTDWTATSAAQGESWMLTFANAKQGMDHDVALFVKFSPPGLTPQVVGRTVLVKPVVYAPKTVAITPATVAIGAGGTAQLGATATDTAGVAMTGVAIRWSSSDNTIASVSSTTGLVTAVKTGQATITAAAGPLSSPATGTRTVTVEGLGFIISGGGGISSTIFVDDILDVYLNGVRVFADPDPLANDIQPISFKAGVGDQLRIVAINNGIPCSEVSVMVLHHPATGQSQVLNDAVFKDNCANTYARGQIFYDKVFTIGIPKP